jgi:hypothetical protein
MFNTQFAKTRFISLVVTIESEAKDSRAEAIEKVSNDSFDSAFTFRALQEAAKKEAKFKAVGFTSEYVESEKFHNMPEEEVIAHIKDELLPDVARRMSSLNGISNSSCSPLDHAAMCGVVELQSELIKLVK